MFRREAACDTSRSGMRSSDVTALANNAGSARRFSPTAPVKLQDAKQAAYLIYAEHLETWNPLDYVLETVEGGWYALGEMSSKGYVVAVSPKRAKVITPEGRTAWIVAMRDKPLTSTESESARSHVAHADTTKESKGLE